MFYKIMDGEGLITLYHFLRNYRQLMAGRGRGAIFLCTYACNHERIDFKKKNSLKKKYL